MRRKRRFAVGQTVRINNPGVTGVVAQADEEPTIGDEYWHKVRTDHGEFHEPGKNLQLVSSAKDCNTFPDGGFFTIGEDGKFVPWNEVLGGAESAKREKLGHVSTRVIHRTR